jgi:hypothetical protein
VRTSISYVFAASGGSVTFADVQDKSTRQVRIQRDEGFHIVWRMHFDNVDGIMEPE